MIFSDFKYCRTAKYKLDQGRVRNSEFEAFPNLKKKCLCRVLTLDFGPATGNITTWCECLAVSGRVQMSSDSLAPDMARYCFARGGCGTGAV